MEYVVKKDGDITVILRQIEIKNVNKWNKTSMANLTSNMGAQTIDLEG
jgi:hypothetical protein